MWAKQLLTQETENEDQAGTTVTYTCGMSTCKVEVEYASTSSRLRLSMVSGACAWSSEWLALSSRLPSEGTDQLIQEAARHLQVLCSLRSRGHVNGLTPLELASLMYQTHEHLLA